MSNNFVELLLNLGVDEASSTKNINKKIADIQKNIDQLDVSLNVKTDGSAEKQFKAMESEIKNLQNQIKELNKSLGDVGKTGGNRKSGTISVAGDIKNEVLSTISSLKELQSYLKGQGYGVTVDMRVDEKGEKQVKSVLASIKNSMGEIETLKIKPTVNQQGVSAFSLVGEKNKDLNSKGFLENQEQALNLLNKIEKQGKLTANSIADYSSRITNASTNTELENTLKLLQRLNQEQSQNTKIRNANNSFSDNVKKSTNEINELRNAMERMGSGTKELDKIESKFRMLSSIDITNEGQIEKADRIYNKLTNSLKQLTADTSTLEKTQSGLTNILDNANRVGAISNDTFNKLDSAVRRLSENRDLPINEKLKQMSALLKEVNNEVKQGKIEAQFKKEMAGAVKEIQKLEAALLKTKNQYTGTVDHFEANRLQQALNASRAMLSSGDTTNVGQIRAYRTELGAIETQIRSLNAQATTGGRNNLTILESFKTAMEKFPVWMLSSSIFFGITRGIGDLTEKVIELDTAMTNLIRVSDGEQFQFDQVIDRAITSVSNLSGEMSGFLDLVTEFARTGKTIDESFDLAETTQMLMNISELNASESVNSLTSAMIAFNIEAEDSIRIADKLNEVNI